MYKRYNQGWLKHLDFILWDAFSLQLAFIFAYVIRQGSSLPYISPIYRNLAILLVVVDILIAAIFNTMHNVMKRGYYNEAIQTLKQVMLVLAVTAIYVFSMQIGDIYSRITIFLTALLHLAFGYCIRLAWKPVVRKMGKDARKTSMLLVADEDRIPEIFDRLSSTDGAEYTGVVLSNRDGTGESIRGIPVVASLKTASDYICREWVDEVFVYPEHMRDIEVHRSDLNENVEEFIRGNYREYKRTDYSRAGYTAAPEAAAAATAVAVEDREAAAVQEECTIATLIEDCRQMAVPVHIRLPLSHTGSKSFIEKVGGYTVLTSAINYASPMQLAIKRIMDIIGGIVGSLIALIVIAIVGPKIKRESPGPILFKQTRIGLNGQRFQIFKIRTMYLDAEERKAELMKQNRVSDGMMFKLDFDPRIIGNKIVDGKQVTGIGERLRSGSWDEWPQFFNVLLSQMSLVGDRVILGQTKKKPVFMRLSVA